VERRARALAKPRRVAVLLRFFRTGPGQYGEGDRFLGLTLPDVRTLAADFRELPLVELERLLESPWHELRAIALAILEQQYRRGNATHRVRLYRLYLRRADRINNWDLVDMSAPQIVGAHLEARSREPLRRLARSSDLWKRRIAIVATLHFIRRGEFGDTLAIVRLLLDDRDDLIHKAMGWMLREVGKRDELRLRAFLDRHTAVMPRTTLRYAIERFSPAARRRYMAMPRRARPTRARS
jgi:3-methyladenine DNA glycosylase AlkD